MTTTMPDHIKDEAARAADQVPLGTLISLASRIVIDSAPILQRLHDGGTRLTSAEAFEIVDSVQGLGAITLGLASHVERDRQLMRDFLAIASVADLSTAPGRRILADAMTTMAAAL